MKALDGKKSGSRAEGVGHGPLFGCITLAAALWLLGLGLDDVVVGRLGEPLHLRQLFGDPSVHPRGQCGILRIPPYEHKQRNVRFGWILVMQNELRVSYCNYNFVVSKTPASYWEV